MSHHNSWVPKHNGANGANQTPSKSSSSRGSGSTASPWSTPVRPTARQPAANASPALNLDNSSEFPSLGGANTTHATGKKKRWRRRKRGTPKRKPRPVDATAATTSTPKAKLATNGKASKADATNGTPAKSTNSAGSRTTATGAQPQVHAVATQSTASAAAPTAQTHSTTPLDSASASESKTVAHGAFHRPSAVARTTAEASHANPKSVLKQLVQHTWQGQAKAASSGAWHGDSGAPMLKPQSKLVRPVAVKASQKAAKPSKDVSFWADRTAAPTCMCTRWEVDALEREFAKQRIVGRRPPVSPKEVLEHILVQGDYDWLQEHGLMATKVDELERRLSEPQQVIALYVNYLRYGSGCAAGAACEVAAAALRRYEATHPQPVQSMDQLLSKAVVSADEPDPVAAAAAPEEKANANGRQDEQAAVSTQEHVAKPEPVQLPAKPEEPVDNGAGLPPAWDIARSSAVPAAKHAASDEDVTPEPVALEYATTRVSTDNMAAHPLVVVETIAIPSPRGLREDDAVESHSTTPEDEHSARDSPDSGVGDAAGVAADTETKTRDHIHPAPTTPDALTSARPVDSQHSSSADNQPEEKGKGGVSTGTVVIAAVAVVAAGAAVYSQREKIKAWFRRAFQGAL